jgi:hypothetical protein
MTSYGVSSVDVDTAAFGDARSNNRPSADRRVSG